MNILYVERLGGVAGFGGSGARLRSRGQLDLDLLAAAERGAIETLFEMRAAAGADAVRDGFRYRISRMTPAGLQTIEVADDRVPTVLNHCVRDELA